MTHNEAGGIAFTELWHKDGWKINVTARGNTLEESIESLMNGIEAAEADSFSPIRPSGKTTQTMPAEFQGKTPFEQSTPELDQPQQGKDWGLVDYKPKAGELRPFDRFEILVEEYKFGEGACKFYKPGLEWPLASFYLGNEYAHKEFERVFPSWTPKSDNEMHALSKPIVLTIQCTGPDRLNKNGNPYQNIIAARADEAEYLEVVKEVPF